MPNLPSKPLNEEQKAYVIKQLARRMEYEEIKSRFQNFFETGITGETIMQLEVKHKDVIEQIRPTVLDPAGSRLAHARVRLDQLEEALLDAKTLRPIGPPIRIGENEWQPGPVGMNVQGIVNIIKACREEEYLAKKLDIEVRKLKLEAEKGALLGSGFSEIVINTGVDDEDEDEVTPPKING